MVGIADNDGNLIAEYEYDECGKLLSITTDDAESYEIAETNPLRYRSYYYDNETGMYYLQSRYYVPQLYRFFNADIPEIAQLSKDIPAGTNLFAYCNNDPVNNVDYLGNKLYIYSPNLARIYAQIWWNSATIIRIAFRFYIY